MGVLGATRGLDALPAQLGFQKAGPNWAGPEIEARLNYRAGAGYWFAKGTVAVTHGTSP